MQTSATLSTDPGNRHYGGHSRTAPLRRVLVRRPAAAAAHDDWAAFGYARPVDQARAEREHAAFHALLAEAGMRVEAVGPDPAGLMDAIFADDAAIMTNAGVIVTRPGKLLRQPEADLAELTFGQLGVPILGRITAPGTVEGGDTCWLDEQTIAVGRSYRTNDEGIRQLRELLAGLGVQVVSYDLPHWHGPDECLHLLSMISPIAPDAAAVYYPLMPTPLVNELQARKWTLIPVPDEELASLGCNVLALAPWKVVALEGNPITRRRLEAAGCEVLTYAGAEISRNREGGPTCLTRAVWRATA